MKHIHFIAVGGAAMHALALDLHQSGYLITGSDDEIYEPSRSRLQQAGIHPPAFGWYPEKLQNADVVVLGMHARPDNPELLKALELGIPVYSYPEFIYQQSRSKTRVVIAGSHGKTTTTAMILHVLEKCGVPCDYLLGAAVPGFDNMVRLSDAPLIVIEGDEYLSSPIDRRPKIHHYHPHITVITGIAWDHINVFPTFENYLEQFRKYIGMIEEKGTLIYNSDDTFLSQMASVISGEKEVLSYKALTKGCGQNVLFEGREYPITIIGKHNLSNLNAARLVCAKLGISNAQFFNSIADFKGAAKRLQVLCKNEKRIVYLDFAHAPSKVKATCEAVKEWNPDKKLLAVLELHTFSSLNKDFIPQYQDCLASADKAVVFYNSHTLEMKNMPFLEPDFVQKAFGHSDIFIFTAKVDLEHFLKKPEFKEYNILLMSSGNFDRLDFSFFS